MESAKEAIEGTLDEVHLEVGRLSKHWDRAVVESSSHHPRLMSSPELVVVHPPAREMTD
jgi:hypothetical protein